MWTQCLANSTASVPIAPMNSEEITATNGIRVFKCKEGYTWTSNQEYSMSVCKAGVHIVNQTLTGTTTVTID